MCCLACIEFSNTPDFYTLKEQVKNLIKQNEITMEHAIEILDKINKELKDQKHK